MFQQIILIGNLGGDPEQRFTPSGVAFTTFSLATSKRWAGADGEQKEKTTWFRVTCWRKQAEIVAQYLAKGSKVMVIGEIEESKPYTDRDGNQRASLNVTAQTVKFLSGKGDSSPSVSSGVAQGGQSTAAEDETFGEGEIPF